MEQYTLEFHVDGVFDHDHNNRRILTGNVDPDRIQFDENWERDPHELVAELFKSELEEYNKKQIAQKHPGRQIKDLYQHLYEPYAKAYREDQNKTSKERKQTDFIKSPEKEITIGLGDIDHHPDSETFKAIMHKYNKGFHERNKNLFETQNSIHDDEPGRIHAHKDIIPKAGKQNKLFDKYSFEKALEEMGFKTYYDKEEGRKVKGFELWMNNERNALKEICKEYDIEIIDTGREEKKKSLSREEYIADKKERQAKQRQEQADKAIAEAPEKVKQAYEEQKSKFIEDQEKTIDEYNERTEKAREEFEQQKKTYQTRIDEYVREQTNIGNQEIERIQTKMGITYDKYDDIMNIYSRCGGDIMEITIEAAKQTSRADKAEAKLKKVREKAPSLMQEIDKEIQDDGR